MTDILAGVYRKIPPWVSTGTITRPEAEILAALVRDYKPNLIVEIGTASGVSTAVLADSAANFCSNWELHTFDLMERCYFDDTKIVGQAAKEMLDETDNVKFYRSTTSLDIKRKIGERKVDFVFIDASHSSPWAAVDLLGVLSNLRRGAIVALHDIMLPFRNGYSNQNASRDLSRNWRGQKWVDETAPNLGMLRFYDLSQALTDIATCLQADWDADRNPEMLRNLHKELSKFSNIDYPGREECVAFLAECPGIIRNNNKYTRASQNPFASGSSIHPSDNEEVEIFWKGIPAQNVNCIQISAFAFNSSLENPGAILEVSVSNKNQRFQKSLNLRPRVMEFVDVAIEPAETIDVSLVARTQLGKTANYSGIRIPPMVRSFIGKT